MTKAIFVMLALVYVSCAKDKADDGPIEPTLINGTKVKDDQEMFWPVVQMFVPGSSCTGTVVGKRAFITAAHCARNGDIARFTVSYGPNKGIEYRAKMTRGPLWGNTVHDVALGYMDKDFVGVPASMHMVRLEIGDVVTLSGYGCIRPGGGGSDGFLRFGLNSVVARGRYDFITKDVAMPGAALCYGDSGGPVFYEKGLAGINSRGNISTTSYLTRMDIEETAKFFESWGVANDATICGFNAPKEECGGEGPTPPEKVLIENSILKVSIELKDGIKHTVAAVRGLFQMIMDYLEDSDPMNTTPEELLLYREKPVTLPGIGGDDENK